jgi:outer membrane protein OmpA-like peptidoglycan-associated protein
MKPSFPVLALALACVYPLSLVGQAVTAPQGRKLVKEVEKEIKLGEDEPGCKDSQLLTRMLGCSIIQCDAKPDAENVEIQIGTSPDGAIQKEAMDGNSEVIYYLCQPKATVFNIGKFAETNLVRAGYKIVFAGKDADDYPLVTAIKDNQWVQVSTYIYEEHSAYIQTAIKVTPEDGMPAESMHEEMSKTGRIVLNNLVFENDSVGTDSQRILNDLASLLAKQPDWRIRIEGHVDSASGDKATSMTTSQKHASVVATWLLEHGIDKTRLSIQGFGDTKPVADNKTEEGQTKNRRIELVRF